MINMRAVLVVVDSFVIVSNSVCELMRHVELSLHYHYLYCTSNPFTQSFNPIKSAQLGLMITLLTSPNPSYNRPGLQHTVEASHKPLEASQPRDAVAKPT